MSHLKTADYDGTDNRPTSPALNSLWAPKRVQLVRSIFGHAAAGAMALFCLAGFLLLVSESLSRLFLLNQTGYGDSYILYDVLQFQKTGVIYRDLSQPPYLPAQYSPLVYMLYSLPGRMVSLVNPFLGPRLIALVMFLGCLAIVASIVRALIPVRSAWLWGILLACSIDVMRDWVLQLRGDFGGILLSLMAIRLLLGRSSRAVLLSGVCAGLATQFKITFVAALAAGALWLLFRRGWKDLAAFAAAGLLSSAGVYFLFWAWEPRMIPQMLAISPGIPDVTGSLTLVYHALREPVVLLALLALPWVVSHAKSRWVLLMVFGAISFAIAGLTSIQAGANINYFCEVLFAIIPAATIGALRALVWVRRSAAAALFLIALVVFHFLPARVEDLYASIPECTPSAIKSANTAFAAEENVLRGQHIFSTVPRLALLDPAPALMEPFLLSYLQRIGKFDPRPILERIRNDEFDVVITSPHSWRGVEFMRPDLRGVIASSYRPQCVIFGTVLHLPRNRPGNDTLIQELNRIGCAPLREAYTNW